MRFLNVFVWCLFLASCARLSSSSDSSRTGGRTNMTSASEQYRFLALGDSYTIGESVGKEDRWPEQLVRLLRAENVPIEDPLIIAKTGWTTDELARAIGEQDPHGPFDLVSLLIGVNNQYRGRSADEYRTEFQSLLNQAIVFAGGRASHVVVLSIPDWGATPFAEGKNRQQISQEIDLFNAINAEESSRTGAQYIDATSISRAAQVDGSLIASDGLHPSAKMYADWSRRVMVKVLPFFTR